MCLCVDSSVCTGARGHSPFNLTATTFVFFAIVCLVITSIIVSIDSRNINKKIETDSDVKSKAAGTGGAVEGEIEPDNEGDVVNDDDDDKDDDSGEAETTVKEEAPDLSKEELALRIYNTITSNILPQLHKCVTKKVSLKKSLCFSKLLVVYKEEETKQR